jgi:hypothetical protein
MGGWELNVARGLLGTMVLVASDYLKA